MDRWPEKEAEARFGEMLERCLSKGLQIDPAQVVEDAMIAATAFVHGLAGVMRNTKDFLDFGVPLLDPFAPP